MPYPSRNKAYSSPHRARSGFYQAKVTKVEQTEGALAGVSIYCPRIGIVPPMSVGPYPNVGPVPAVGDTVWISFVEGKQDDLIVFNPQATTFSWDVDTLVVDTTNDSVLFNTTTAVLDAGGSEYHPVVIQAKDSIHPAVKIIPGSTVNTTRASLMLHKTIMGAGNLTGDEGDWYVYDNDNTKYNLLHSGHSDVANGGLTVWATGTHTAGAGSGTHERYISFRPSHDSGGYEWSAIFMDNASNASLMNTVLYTYGLNPYADNTYDVGSSLRWQDIHLVNQPTVTSDQNEKTDIADSDLGLDFVNALRPVSFKWIDRGGGEAGVRTHYGLLGQEVEAVLGAAASDTAIWINQPIEAEPEVPADEHLPGRPAVEEHDRQGLRYTELISPMIKAIQELTTRVAALEG